MAVLQSLEATSPRSDDHPTAFKASTQRTIPVHFMVVRNVDTEEEHAHPPASPLPARSAN